MSKNLFPMYRRRFRVLLAVAAGIALPTVGAFADESDGTLDVGELTVQSADPLTLVRFEAGVTDVEKAVQPGLRLSGTRIALWTAPGNGPTGDLHATVLKQLLEQGFHLMDLERTGRVNATFSDNEGNRTVAVVGSAQALLMFAPVIEADYLLVLRIADVVEDTWKPILPQELESDWTDVTTATRDVYIVRLEAELIRTSGPDLCALWSIESTAETDEEAIHLAALALIEEVVR